MADGNGLARSYDASRLITPGFAFTKCRSAHLGRHYHDVDPRLLRMTRADSAALPVVPRPTPDDGAPMPAACMLRTCCGSPRRPACLRIASAPTISCRRCSPWQRWPDGSILNALDLVRDGADVILAGPTRESFRQTDLALPHLTTMLPGCPDPDRLSPGHPAHAYARQPAQPPPSSAGTPLPATGHRAQSFGWYGGGRTERQTVPQRKSPGAMPGLFHIAEAASADQVFIESKNSEFCLVWRSLSKRNSIASCGPIGLRMRRST